MNKYSQQKQYRPQRPHHTPSEKIEKYPYRKTTAERNFRILVQTSFDHSLAGNLTMGVAKGLSQTGSPDFLNKLAEQILSDESYMTVFDYVRRIEIFRLTEDHTDTFTIMAKRLNVDSIDHNVTDSDKNHIELWTREIPVHNGDKINAQVAKQIARELLNAYFRSTASGVDRQRPLEQINWFRSTRELQLDDSHSGGGFNDLSWDGNRVIQTTDELIDYIASELQEHRNFHAILQHSNIFMKHQGISIYLDLPDNNNKKKSFNKAR